MITITVKDKTNPQRDDMYKYEFSQVRKARIFTNSLSRSLNLRDFTIIIDMEGHRE